MRTVAVLVASSAWLVAPVAGAVAALAGCGGGHAAPDAQTQIDDAPNPPPDAHQMTLADTGLCPDPGCQQISADAHEYVPRFPLWADTATKRRWVSLPAGTKIDTTDPDHWVFPMGTKFWKEFTRDGIRVETRYITKLAADDDAPGAWFYISFAWNQAQDAASPVTAGVQNANGTMQDIPSRADCQGCHENLKPGRVLGFGAIQLDHTDPNGMLDLDKIDAMGWLSQSPPAATNGAHYPFPADATQAQNDALGYLHANCGHCHNPSSTVHDMTPLVLRLDTTKLATVATTPTYLTTTNAAALFPFSEGTTTYTTLIVPKDPDHSALNVRINVPITATMNRHMPKLGSEMTDPQVTSLVLGWINALN
ncbi:MAG TPA: hypothetical protein VH165_09810 [Kofleriaceae bacterium]|jgi:cytochrome c553|nr:hypothetical protein [Kofleriaceae bacterium]